VCGTTSVCVGFTRDLRCVGEWVHPPGACQCAAVDCGLQAGVCGSPYATQSVRVGVKLGNLGHVPSRGVLRSSMMCVGTQGADEDFEWEHLCQKLLRAHIGMNISEVRDQRLCTCGTHIHTHVVVLLTLSLAVVVPSSLRACSGFDGAT